MYYESKIIREEWAKLSNQYLTELLKTAIRHIISFAHRRAHHFHFLGGISRHHPQNYPSPFQCIKCDNKDRLQLTSCKLMVGISHDYMSSYAEDTGRSSMSVRRYWK